MEAIRSFKLLQKRINMHNGMPNNYMMQEKELVALKLH